MRIDEESLQELRKRVSKINNVDLKKMGINSSISQIDLARFLFKNPIYITDNELRNMARIKKRTRRLC